MLLKLPKQSRTILVRESNIRCKHFLGISLDEQQSITYTSNLHGVQFVLNFTVSLWYKLDVLTYTRSINTIYNALYPQLRLSPVLIFKGLEPLFVKEKMCFRVPHNTDRMCQGLSGLQ